jgi:CheY-like chemotaxis protein
LTVLLVEDEPDIRFVARLALQREGAFTVVEADSGAGAMVLVAAGHVDVVLLDVMMPEMDGPEVLQALAGDPSTADIPVVFLTAKATPDDLSHLRMLGAAGVITKPFDATTLAADLRSILDGGVASPWSTSASSLLSTRTVNEAALTKLDGLVGDDGRDIRLDLYDLFAERTPVILSQLQAAALTGADASTDAARLAHSLKSAAATLGLDGMARVCARIETQASAGRMLDAAPLIDHLVREFEPALALLKDACLRFASTAPVSHPDRSS